MAALLATDYNKAERSIHVTVNPFTLLDVYCWLNQNFDTARILRLFGTESPPIVISAFSYSNWFCFTSWGVVFLAIYRKAEGMANFLHNEQLLHGTGNIWIFLEVFTKNQPKKSFKKNLARAQSVLLTRPILGRRTISIKVKLALQIWVWQYRKVIQPEFTLNN